MGLNGVELASTITVQSANVGSTHNFEVTEDLVERIHFTDPAQSSLAFQAGSSGEGNLSFAESYARIENGEAFIQGLHISEYKNARMFGHEATRRRKLLLHKKEIRKLYKAVSIRGQTLIPLKVYFNKRGIAKVLLGICKGKHSHDKRAAKRKRDSDREIRREISKYSD